MRTDAFSKDSERLPNHKVWSARNRINLLQLFRTDQQTVGDRFFANQVPQDVLHVVTIVTFDDSFQADTPGNLSDDKARKRSSAGLKKSSPHLNRKMLVM